MNKLGRHTHKHRETMENQCYQSHVLSLSVVSDSGMPWTIAYQAPLSMELSRQEYSSEYLFPSPGIFPTQGSNPVLPQYRQSLYRLRWDSLNFLVLKAHRPHLTMRKTAEQTKLGDSRWNPWPVLYKNMEKNQEKSKKLSQAWES